jgi:molybdate transport system substrate-binding protein
VLATAAVVLAGCGNSAGAAGASSSHRGVRGTVVVFAAASLTDAFTTLAHRFETAHPGTSVRLSFGGSDTLATQIVQGAPADVFASASAATMDTVTSAGEALGTPATFASNELEIAVPPGNPAHVATLADTTRPGVKLALCDATVPCGALATKVYDNAHLAPHPVTLEQDVKAVLTKVELDEVDAGLVYRTDVRAAGPKVTGVDFAGSSDAVTHYPVVTLKGGHDHAGAAAFVAYLQSATGRGVLTAAGFGPP